MSEHLALDEVVDAALDALRRRRIDAGEVYLRDSQSGSVEVKDGAFDTVIAHGERGIAVRVIERRRAGLAYTCDLSADGVEDCVAAAIAMAAVNEPEDDLRLASEPVDAPDLGIHEAGLGARPLAERGAVALGVEEAARAFDSRISGFRKTTYSDADVTTTIATTHGVRASYRETFFSAGTAAVAAQDGERQIGSHGVGGRRFADVSARAVGRRAAELAVGKLGARDLKTQRLPVVLDPWMGMALLGAIAPLFSADNVLKGKSLFAGKIGQRVASAAVTIVDDGRRPGAVRSAPFDGEGAPTTTRTLVEEGVLRAYLTDRKTSRKLGVPTGGNARRGSYAAPARIGPSNFFARPGGADAAALLRGLDRALAITSLLNLHTIDPISGEFSLGATGDYLEKGERLYPVQGVTIAGNLTELLSSITGVGDDLVFGPGGIGSPTLVIAELSIGGT